ncbi:hypothetical protein E5288_WYG016731 [Bos mutus]|uniref:Uncharacterized protein n=1 Tax=Bos mutus TaxID=72004 RepID=A0A6B0R618_9CETA|nr:hypothetical protein [Bos mutus]
MFKSELCEAHRDATPRKSLFTFKGPKQLRQKKETRQSHSFKQTLIRRIAQSDPSSDLSSWELGYGEAEKKTADAQRSSSCGIVPILIPFNPKRKATFSVFIHPAAAHIEDFKKWQMAVLSKATLHYQTME